MGIKMAPPGQVSPQEPGKIVGTNSAAHPEVGPIGQPADFVSPQDPFAPRQIDPRKGAVQVQQAQQTDPAGAVSPQTPDQNVGARGSNMRGSFEAAGVPDPQSPDVTVTA